MKVYLSCLLELFSCLAAAQSLRQSEHRTLVIRPNQTLTIQYEQPYSSALIYLPEGQSLAGTYLIAAGDTLPLFVDPHASTGQPVSALCVFRRPVSQLSFQTGLLTGEATVLTLYVPPLPTGYVQQQVEATARHKADCSKPAVIPASVWRKGLTPPKELPVQTKVQFIIVHHSAGSNTTTDFTEEVRNIYLQHTTINGWNDIGYNFLIGQDGVIYEGRDGQGILDGDNVLGAHFCSQNSGTMGICLMGNFNDIKPSVQSIASLDQLIGWKLKKESLQPVGMAYHPGSAKQLNTISGHRDGVCSTECPGDNLYDALPTVRREVGNVCSFSTVEPTPLATESADLNWVVYPNPSQTVFYVQHKAVDPAQVRFELIDGLGRIHPMAAVQVADDRWRLATETAADGLYWLRCTDATTTTIKQLWRIEE